MPDAPSAAHARRQRLCRALALGLGLSFAVSTAFAQDRRISFDIPAQPLADALLTYGTVTGIEVFYDGSLAIGRRSAAVTGVLTPMSALQTLLDGTGYVPKATDYADTITIVRAPREAAASHVAALSRYEPYFAVLQARIGAALCRVDEARPGDKQIMLSLWLDASGTVTHLQVLGSEISHGRNLAIASSVAGVRVGRPPPAGLPQPVTMAIYPPLPGEAAGCLPHGRQHAAN